MRHHARAAVLLLLLLLLLPKGIALQGVAAVVDEVGRDSNRYREMCGLHHRDWNFNLLVNFTDD